MEIITASFLLPMTNSGPVISDGAIAVEMGRIEAVGDAADLEKRFPDAEVKRFPGGVLMPGLVNAHCQLDLVDFFDAPARGGEEEVLPQREFAETLMATIDYKNDAEPQRVAAGIQKGINRLIETGITAVGDVTFYEGTFELLRDAGLRSVVFPEIVAGRGEAAQQRFEVALALVEKYTDISGDRLRVGLAPSAPYLLSRNLLKIISRHAKDASIPLMIHAAESFAEMEFFFDSAGPIATEVFPGLGWDELPPAQRTTPVSYLAEIGFFEAPTTIVGGLHLAKDDFPALARHLVRVVWCPTMNHLMGHGTFPYGKLSEHGIPMGLGTECWQHAMGFNLWEEMRMALGGAAQPPPTPKEVLRLATIGGARALGLDPIVGTLEAGKQADYLIVRAPPGATADEGLYAKLIQTTQPQHILLSVAGESVLKSA